MSHLTSKNIEIKTLKYDVKIVFQNEIANCILIIELIVLLNLVRKGYLSPKLGLISLQSI